MKQLDLFGDNEDLFLNDCENFILELESKIKELEDQEQFFEENQAFEWDKEFPQCCDENGKWVGFDAIIGNPPYFSLAGNKRNVFYSEFYQTFVATGDISSLFIERAINLLKNKGNLSFIITNRFCKTEYGLSTRKHLSEFKINALININNTDVFEMANVGTLIFSLSKENPDDNNEISLFDIKNFNEFGTKRVIPLELLCKTKQKYFNENHWIFKNSEILEIKQKMDKAGKPFSKINDLKTYRGITTGLNDVFIINETTKNFLIEEHKSSEKIIKPLLRGGNINNYFIDKPKEWVIFTRRGIDIKKYPAIEKYLMQFKDKLEPGIGRKKGKYKWFEIQDNTAYYEEFEKEKIIWGQISSRNHFALSTDKEYSLNSTFIATGKNLKFYCAVLNSKAVLFYVKLGAVIWGKDGIKWLGDYFFNTPIPLVPEVKQKSIIDLVNQILELKKQNPEANIEKFEKQIDKLVYKLYNLTKEEIKIIENETA